MGAWYLSIGASLLLIFIGLYTHWTVLLVGALLPFLPLIIHLLQRNRQKSTDK